VTPGEVRGLVNNSAVCVGRAPQQGHHSDEDEDESPVRRAHSMRRPAMFRGVADHVPLINPRSLRFTVDPLPSSNDPDSLRLRA
jgi:hypothetical protein